MRVTVLGAGVSGLTTAIVLQRAGHDVQVVAREKGMATTSGAAGAVWFPFHVGPPDRALIWARSTRERLTTIAATSPEAGVDMLDAYTTVDVDTSPWWARAAESLTLTGEPRLFGEGRAWKMRVPRCDPRLYLPWLEAHLRTSVALHDVDRLDDLPGDCVVNCAGIGARRLAADDALVPNLGQTVVVSGAVRPDAPRAAPTSGIEGSASLDPEVMFSDDRDMSRLFYVIPRRREFVLGGCAIDVESTVPPSPDPDLARSILDRCRQRGFDPGAVLEHRTGLRPARRAVRLEREGRVVHNYGHGGAGYSLSWGCAEEVAALLAGW
jgi:D-amino-acid oxidase